jgi:membrane associated rhomboid family serine protease
MGPARFAGFYVIAGLVSGMVQVLTGPDPGIPHVGASGAVSGVLGAFLLLFPFRPMGLLALTAIHPGLLGMYVLSRVLRLERGIIQVPAVLYLLLWFGVQVFASTVVETRGGGRIDFLAHVAGFAAGVLLVIPFAGANYSRAVRMPDEE